MNTHANKNNKMKYCLLVTKRLALSCKHQCLPRFSSGLPLCVSFVVSSLLSCNSLNRFYTQVLPVFEINTVLNISFEWNHKPSATFQKSSLTQNYRINYTFLKECSGNLSDSYANLREQYACFSRCY